MSDLEDAIKLERQAVSWIRHRDAPEARGTLLANLGAKLGYRYERTNELEDLKESIKITTESRDAVLNGLPLPTSGG